MKRFGLLMLLLIILLLPGCQYSAPDHSRIIIAQSVDATTLDPHMHNETTSANVTGQIFDSLFIRDENMALIPNLAEGIEMLDAQTWEVTLKDGIHFHNGEDFNAETVRFSIERLMKPENASPQISSVNMIEKVIVIDEKHLQIVTKAPYPLLPERLTMAMVPPQYLENVGSEKFAVQPVGTGPYVFQHWIKDEEVALAANPEYFRGQPQIGEVVFRVIPEGSVRIASLQNGQVDLISNVPPHQVAALMQDQRLSIVSVPSGRIIFIQWVTDRDGPIADPKVRRALQHGINVEEIISHILDGYGVPINQPLTTLDFGYHPDIEGLQYDPEKGRKLLQQAGYSELTVIIDSPVGRYAMDREVIQVIAGQLETMGVNVQLNFNEWGVHVGRILEREMEGGYLIGWGSSIFDADATLYPNFHSEQRISFFKNGQVDELLENARQTMDAGTRQLQYRKAVEIIMEEAAVMPLYQPVDIYGLRKGLAWQPRADERIYVYDMTLSGDRDS